MVVKRARKTRKWRGSRECGWGNKHRGSGKRGGVGNAGTGKRAKCKMPRAGRWANMDFGKHGFKFKGVSVDMVPINVIYLDAKVDSWVAEKKVVLENGVYVVDLPKLGFNKLLSCGKTSKKFRINVPFASKSAVDKIAAAGGEVVGLKKAE